MNKENSNVDEGLKPMVVGHLLIRDLDTGEVLLNQRDENSPKDNNGSE